MDLNESRSDIVLGLFPEVEARKTDMVDIEDSGVKQAVEGGMNVQGVVLAQESYVDIGTPDSLIAVARTSSW